jgi:hypothetical protein
MGSRFASAALRLLVCAALLLGCCHGRFVVEKNSLKVTAPDDLKGTYECAIGNFGVPQYGGTMVGFVAYPKANRKACKSFDDFDISYKAKPGAFPTFLLVDRGGERVASPPSGRGPSDWLVSVRSPMRGLASEGDLCMLLWLKV